MVGYEEEEEVQEGGMLLMPCLIRVAAKAIVIVISYLRARILIMKYT